MGLLRNLPKSRWHTRGFALVELLFYFGILIVVVSTCVALVLSFDGLVEERQVEQKLTRTGSEVFERVVREIRDADMVQNLAIDSALATSSGHLVMSKEATDVEIYLENGAVMYAWNDGIPEQLHSDDVTIDELWFYRYDSGVSEAVRVRLVLSTTVGETTMSETFETAAILRNSYE